MSLSKSETSPSARKLNNLSAISFGVICVCIGIPIWIMTTTVYRAALPTDRIKALTHANVSVPVSVKLVNPQEKGLLQLLAADLRKELPTKKVARVEFHFSYEVVESETTTSERSNRMPQLSGLSLTVTLNPRAIGKPKARVDCQNGIVVEYPEKMESSAELVGFLKVSILNYYLSIRDLAGMLAGVEQKRTYDLAASADSDSFEAQFMAILTSLRNGILMEDTKPPPKVVHWRPSPKTSKGFVSHLAPLPEYSVDIFLLNPQPDEACVPRLNTSLINDYLQFALGPLSPVTKFKVSSQSIFYVDLPIYPVETKASAEDGSVKKTYSIPQASLPHLISPIEKQIIPNMARDAPTRQFLIYLPPPKKSPLYIESGEESNSASQDSFVISSWGGMSIYNDYRKACVDQDNHLASLDSKWIAQRVVGQLRQLLAISPTSPGLERPPTCALSAMDRDRAVAFATFHHIYHSEGTLVSLVGLLDQITNIVIDDNVASLIERSVTHLENALVALNDGNLPVAVKASINAYEASEKAFFDQKLLALLYFPNEQKYAIYIPLFLPVGVPVVISLVRLLKSMKRGSQDASVR